MAVSVHLKHGSGTSIRDRFGCLSVEGVDIPYILREGKEKFVPVRAVERDILSYYPSAYPKEIEERPPLVCHYMKPEEVGLLNRCCKQQQVDDHFTDADPVVKLSDFLDFFTIVKQAYPDVVVGKTTPSSSPSSGSPNIPDYGWVLIKDALVPYVVRRGSRFAPLNVIRGAAQLFVDVTVQDIGATEAEVACLNEMCRNVGLVFTFQKSTLLVDLSLTARNYPQYTIHDLPKENPMDFINSIQLAADVTQIIAASSATQHPTSIRPKRCVEDHGATSLLSATISSQVLSNADEGQGQNETCLPGPANHNDRSHLDDGKSTGQEDSSADDVEDTRSDSSHSNAIHVNSADSQVSPKTKHVASATKTTTSEAKSTKKTSTVTIEPMECFGRTVSCLLRGKTNVAYALVEAVCRVYFPSCSLVDFIHFLELDLAVTLYALKRSEEEAFIEFYGIPTKHLRCNQLIKLQDLKDRMGWLQHRFGSVENPDSGEEDAMNDDENMDAAWQLHAESNLEDEECLSRISDKDNCSLPGNWNEQYPENGDNIFHVIRMENEARENGTTSSSSSSDQNGKNKNLENTIMRILHEKREIIIQHAVSKLETENKANVDHYPECRSNNLVSEHQQRAHSVNKRKGAPPRKYTAINHPKVMRIISEIKTETPDMAAENGDIDRDL